MSYIGELVVPRMQTQQPLLVEGMRPRKPGPPSDNIKGNMRMPNGDLGAFLMGRIRTTVRGTDEERFAGISVRDNSGCES
mmetsp:Transcript_5385/g.13487  ORF Transcript_5385/g.13487 Transcript_5385/m.13487 type:complete len:80 (+) Transcript_5385:1296-1535(+)